MFVISNFTFRERSGEMDKGSLQKKTVADLKEMAKQIPDVKGLSSMKKDEIIELLLAHGNGGETGSGNAKAAPKSASKGASAKKAGALNKGEIKQLIRALKQEKREALSSQDRARVKLCNRRIHDYKRQLRKMAAGGKRQ
jgi:hypothetical protein